MKFTTSTKLLISSLGLCHVSVSAFVPESLGTTSSFIQRSNPIPSLHTLNALPNGGSELIDLHQSLSHLIDTSSTLLSDAAAAAAVVVEEEKLGAWDSYLQLYKSLLETVHSTIDAPLRSVGWDQTWGVSIFLFTAGVRTALLPLSIQQTKSSEYIKVLKPYQDEIKKKFKDNQDMINRATAKLFEDANTNPLAGCLVSILQLPILLGLYRGVTLLAKDGQLNEPFLWIPSLEGPVSPPEYRDIDWLTSGWVDGHPQLGWTTTLLYLIMPVVLILGQSITMKVLTPGVDENASKEEKEQMEKTQGVLKFLPLLIGFFSLQVPAGLTIYWFTSNLYTLSQSLAIRAYYKANPPDIELPDYWDSLDNVENMSPEEKRKAAAAGMSVGPKWEDVLDEARYHYLVERIALREGSEAWERVKKDDIGIPKEMVAWVNNELELSDAKKTSGKVEAVKA
jgi:YidC/Oxa1 family membrane protein insertase